MGIRGALASVKVRMDKQLNISTTLSLPQSVQTQREAILAVSGAGKSNAARVMAEESFALKLPFVAVDPKGDWWGLRSGRDGAASGGLDVVIFGGSHGDVPLERGGGAFVADLISKERLSSVLDLSGFESEAAKKQFLLEFGSRLYLKNQDPLKLYLDEADDYIPQRPMKDELRLLRMFENIVRRGRTKGLGICLVTQRSASVNKNVLTQCETLYAMRTTGPQDVKAIEEWMKYHGADRQMLASLATLADGEAWVWSPHYLKKMERFRFRLSHTFDSGATPTNHRAGSKRRPATLADVDVASIAEKMKETIERVASEDPRVLQQRVRELEKQLRAAMTGAEARSSKAEAVNLSEADLLPWRQWVGRLRAELELEQQRSDGALRRVEELETHVAQIYLGLEQLERWKAQRPKPWTLVRVTNADLERLALEKMPGAVANGRLNGKKEGSAGSRQQTADSSGSGEARSLKPEARSPSAVSNGAGLARPSIVQAHPRGPMAGEMPAEMSKGEIRVLGALSARGPLSKTRLAILSGYRHTAGGFAVVMANLKSRGCVSMTEDRLLSLTPEGVARAKGAPSPPTGEELVQLWSGKLSTAAARLFMPIVEARGAITAQEAADAAGYKNAGAGNVADGLKELRGYGLVVGSNKALSLGESREDFA